MFQDNASLLAGPLLPISPVATAVVVVVVAVFVVIVVAVVDFVMKESAFISIFLSNLSDSFTIDLVAETYVLFAATLRTVLPGKG